VTLKERLKESELYDMGNGQSRLIAGGDISNTLSFDEDSSLYVPASYRAIDADSLGSGWWKYRNGEYGYTVNINQGIIRIHPIRGNWSKYLEISAITPTQLEYRNIHDKLLELYKDTATVRWSFIISDRGFKTIIKVKDGYLGNGQFRLGYRLEGLAMNDIKDMIPTPFGLDSSKDAEPFEISETVKDGEVTISADLTGKTFPVFLDPQLTVQPTDGDTRIVSSTPTTNYGSETSVRTGRASAFINRSLIEFDLSAIPAGSTIDSVTESMYYFAFNQSDPSGTYFNYLFKCLRAFVELTSTWNVWDTGQNWTTAGAASDGSDYTSTNQSTQDVIMAGFDWYDHTSSAVVAQVQDALDNESGILRQLFVRDDFPSESGNSQMRWYSRDEVTQTTLRPKIVVNYTEADGINNLSRSRMANAGVNSRLSRGGIANAA
jgi:hypothetical protein